VLTPEPRAAAPPRTVLPYPRGFIKWLLRAPLLFYRLGLGELLARGRLVVLTTRGRVSGQSRHTIVEYRMHGSKIYLISGWGTLPHWVKNLQADPCGLIQAGPRRYSVRAQMVENTSEVLRALLLFRKPAPNVYDALLARITDAESVDARSLPSLASQLTVIRLDIVDEPNDLRPFAADLVWVWAVAGVVGSLAAVVVFSRRRQVGQA
jgi:deazaflavin-dependent oxidoreductase (nitroreductase family)